MWYTFYFGTLYCGDAIYQVSHIKSEVYTGDMISASICGNQNISCQNFLHTSWLIQSLVIKHVGTWLSKLISYIRGRVKISLQPSFFSSHGCIYRKVAVSTSSRNPCLSCHVTWIVLHTWLHYGISIKTMHFVHCL